ncbi:MAG: archaeosine synthase subunit alpha [Halobacteriaceae archaeon]
MTDYFEVLARDGAARAGELRLEDPVATPAVVGDDLLADAGSLWTDERAVPEGDESALTVLPHRGFPRGTASEVEEAFAVDYPDVDYPSAAVVSPDTAADHGADAYVLSGAPGLVGHASAFVEAVVETRRSIPDDTALVLSGVATPENLPLLAYAGVDLVDEARAVVRGTQGRYLTSDGETRLDDLDALPCPCPACAGGVAAFDREDCVEHNVAALRAEARRVRQRIREGRLRDYLEGQARFQPWLTAAFRRFDQEWGYLEERTPVVRSATMAATTSDAIRRVEVRRFADRVTARYDSAFDDAPLLLVPCSAAKPYGESRSHSRFQDAARYRAHKVSLTSPLGVVPRELELTYPAQHYDAAVTGRWSEDEVDFVAEVLDRYLDRHDYPRVVAHVPDDGYRAVVERAVGDRDVPVTYTVADHPTDDESLSALRDALAGEPSIPVADHEHATVRAVADYQFGAGAGEALFPAFETEGRHPKQRAVVDGEQLAALVPEYGVLSLTLAGARRWVESDVPVRQVAIDDFVPRGSVLAPGVVDADGAIRPGDEVVVEGPGAFGVGRATMHGAAMVESTRGVAVTPRHVEERV